MSCCDPGGASVINALMALRSPCGPPIQADSQAALCSVRAPPNLSKDHRDRRRACFHLLELVSWQDPANCCAIIEVFLSMPRSASRGWN